jgi:hypothetical protein
LIEQDLHAHVDGLGGDEVPLGEVGVVTHVQVLDANPETSREGDPHLAEAHLATDGALRLLGDEIPVLIEEAVQVESSDDERAD